MNDKYTVPTDEQVSLIKAVAEGRTDWKYIYEALAMHGRIIVPELPKGMKHAVYGHYRNAKRKVSFTRIKDTEKYLIELVIRQ